MTINACVPFPHPLLLLKSNTVQLYKYMHNNTNMQPQREESAVVLIRKLWLALFNLVLNFRKSREAF